MLDLNNSEIVRAVLESLPTGVCVVDRDLRINFWNDGAERITGYLCQDVLGRFCGEILLIMLHERKEAFCENSCPLAAAMRDGMPRELRVYLHHKAGYAVPVSMRTVPIRDAHGHVIGAVESFIERPWTSPRRPPGLILIAGQGLDALTQLPDYASAESYLMDRLKYASEHAIPFGLLCIQLDQMETLTAMHGVDAAEAILKAVAHTLRNALDLQDFVGRWSEDQFLAIVADCTESDLVTTAGRLTRLAQASEIVWWGDQLSATVSVGGSAWQPGEPLSPLLDRASSALHQAVDKGGNFASVLCAPDSP